MSKCSPSSLSLRQLLLLTLALSIGLRYYSNRTSSLWSLIPPAVLSNTDNNSEENDGVDVAIAAPLLDGDNTEQQQQQQHSDNVRHSSIIVGATTPVEGGSAKDSSYMIRRAKELRDEAARLEENLEELQSAYQRRLKARRRIDAITNKNQSSLDAIDDEAGMPHQVHFVTYGGDAAWDSTIERLCITANRSHWFQSLTAFNETVVPNDFRNEYSDILTNYKRGGGSYLWRFPMWDQALQQLPLWDYIFFVDGGLTINSYYGTTIMLDWLQQLETASSLNNNDGGRTRRIEIGRVICGGCLEQGFSSLRVFEAFGIPPSNNASSIRRSDQLQLSPVLARNGPHMRRLIATIYETLAPNPYIITNDYDEETREHIRKRNNNNNTTTGNTTIVFHENKHDQAIASLANKVAVPYLAFPYNMSKRVQPVLMRRVRKYTKFLLEDFKPQFEAAPWNKQLLIFPEPKTGRFLCPSLFKVGSGRNLHAPLVSEAHNVLICRVPLVAKAFLSSLNSASGDDEWKTLNQVVDYETFYNYLYSNTTRRIALVQHPVTRILAGFLAIAGSSSQANVFWTQLYHFKNHSLMGDGPAAAFERWLWESEFQTQQSSCSRQSKSFSLHPKLQHWLPPQHCRCGMYDCNVEWTIVRVEEETETETATLLNDWLSSSNNSTTAAPVAAAQEDEGARKAAKDYLTPRVLQLLNEITREEQDFLGYSPFVIGQS